MRLGLIGLGRIGAFHAETLSSLDVVEGLLITDAVPATSEGVAARVGAEVVDTPEDLLRAGVDGVLIASSTPTHPELLRAAVEAGVPTFCEKPVAQDLASASEILKRVEDSGVAVQVGFPRRFDPAFLRLRDEVVSGRLGWLHTVRSTTLDPAPPPAAYIGASGGIFHDCAVHDFDAVRWLTGCEVIEVYAAGSNRGEAFIAEARDADTTSAVLTLDDGTLEAHGSLDAMAAGLDDRLPLRSADASVTFPKGPPATFFMDRLAVAFRAELVEFTEVVAGARTTPCSVADAVEASWIAEACTLSRREHRPVDLADLR